MFKSLILSAVFGEGIVGITLTILLLRGHQDTTMIANTLSIVGAMAMLVGVFPTGNAGRAPASPMLQTMVVASRAPRVFRSEGLGRVLCTFVVSAIVIGTALLFYFIPVGI